MMQTGRQRVGHFGILKAFGQHQALDKQRRHGVLYGGMLGLSPVARVGPKKAHFYKRANSQLGVPLQHTRC